MVRASVVIDHLHGGEFFEDTSRCEAGRERVEASGERDVQTIGEEDMRLDTLLALMEDRSEREIAFEVFEGFLDLDERQVEFHSLAGSLSVRLVRNRYRPSRRRA